MTTIKESVFTHIDEADLNQCRQVFAKYDLKNQGYIDYYDLKEGLHEVGIDFNHPNVFYKIISELQSTSPYITFKDFVKIYAKKKESQLEEGEPDIIDAYVAMGGDEDGGGCVDADKLIDVIKNEFGMTIDIEEMIKEVDEDGSGEIEIGEFETLLQNEGQNTEIEAFKDWFSF